jgi:hypothetical protein
MEDYLHAIKVGRHSVVEFAESYLKGYVLTWWRKGRPMATHGKSSRNTLNWNSFQIILITFQGANFVTL